MLDIDNITYSYGRKKKPVLQNYSLSIGPGTICGLLGRNGAGKSTLLYLVCGLLRPQQGTVSYNGFNPLKRDVEFLNDVFIVPEEFYLPNVKLSEFVKTMSPFYPRFSMNDMEKHLMTFEMMPDVHLGQLSMGQKKRVFISFALACNTSLLILDEPTNGLDIPGKRLFRKAVLNGMNDDKTIIISTHQVYDVEKIIDHVVITDTDGVLLDAGMFDISTKLKFVFTNDRCRAEKALISLDAPGGYNIVEISDGEEETDVNLETLFELTRERQELIGRLFSNTHKNNQQPTIIQS
ncbi:MAG: ABC transporter ATP-binding protein [Muribaculaceae bacterium]|nr:ABC transporter ATP-binding protein [Muribaculaceae bacterium]MDE5712672.1 ABC transporter ATP-binding protein [Muribaculaceae bacterium]